MLRIAANNAWRLRRRLFGTVVAIVIGVGFLVGTMVLGDTFVASFDRLFTDTAAGTDVVVRSSVSVSDEPDARRGFIDDSVVDAVREVEGVERVGVEITGYGQILGSDGDALGGNGPPRIAAAWIDDPDLNPYELVEGRAPVDDDEVVINRGAADDGDLHVGDRTVVQTPRPVDVTVVGIATFGGQDGFGQTTYAAFSLAGAQQHITGSAEQISSVVVAAEPHASPEQVRDRIAAELPDGVEAITGSDLVDERLDSIAFLSTVRAILVGFAAVALLVAAVSIHNTFTITLGQRTRELALLRTLGATRRQVRRVANIEAAAVGGVASILGCLAGIGLAVGLRALFGALGSGLPDGALTVRPLAIVAGLAAGVVTTLLAARGPSRHAADVAPIEALRSSTTDAPLRRRRLVLGTVLAGGALLAAFAGGNVVAAALGASMLLVATLLVAPWLLASLLRVGGRRFAGRGSGRFATDNLARQPRRAAGAATPLVLGVAVVALFTVFIGSLADAIDEQATVGFGDADLAVDTPAFGGGVLDVAITDDLRAVDGVDRSVGVARFYAVVDGDAATVTAADVADLSAVVDIRTVAGAAADRDGVVIDEGTAEARDLEVGAPVTIGFADGAEDQFDVTAVVEDSLLLDGVVVPLEAWSAHQPQPAFSTVYITLDDGAGPATREAIGTIADTYTGSVEDRGGFADSRSGALDQLLTVIYIMLALAIVIALSGIANTLSLAVHERRREIGLLRAIGQTRRQTRATLRIESLVIACFGTVLGCVVGAVAGAAVFRAAFDDEPITVPVTRLAVIAVVGTVAGLVAVRRPARRAARLPILDAIGAE
jgi:putative ABC transport system permease protein